MRGFLSGGGLILLALLLTACGKEENSPEMGAVPPKPNPSVMGNVPGGASGVSTPGADAKSMGQGAKGL